MSSRSPSPPYTRSPRHRSRSPAEERYSRKYSPSPPPRRRSSRSPRHRSRSPERSNRYSQKHSPSPPPRRRSDDENSNSRRYHPYEQQQQQQISKKIIVFNLAWETSDDSLHKAFDERFGSVDQAFVVRDSSGRSRGFGFVVFLEVKDAQVALDDSKPIKVDGRRVDIKPAVPLQNDKPASRSSSSSSSSHFSNKKPSKPSYEDEYNLSAPSKSSLRTKRIFVGRLPPSVVEDDLRSYFSQYGSISDVFVPRDRSAKAFGHSSVQMAPNKGFGFVTFDSFETVDLVMSKTHEIGGKEVAIDKAEPRDPKDDFKDSSSQYGSGNGREGGGREGNGREGYGGYPPPPHHGGYGGYPPPPHHYDPYGYYGSYPPPPHHGGYGGYPPPPHHYDPYGYYGGYGYEGYPPAAGGGAAAASTGSANSGTNGTTEEKESEKNTLATDPAAFAAFSSGAAANLYSNLGDDKEDERSNGDHGKSSSRGGDEEN